MNAFRIAAVLCALLTPYAMAQAPSQPMVPSATGGSSLATPVSGANGGTGIANTGSTITLGASVVTTGAGAPTLAFPATPQTYTFPTTAATLARTDAAQTFTGAQTFGAGALATPSIVLGNATTGLWSVSTTGFGIAVNGTNRGDWGITSGSAWTFSAAVNTGFFAGSNSSGTYRASAVGNAYLSNPADATWQYGLADGASPVAQTIRVQSVIAGTSNTAGADASIVASAGTGTGVGGKLILKTAVTGTTGTTQNSSFPLVSLNPGSATTSAVQFGDGTNITTYDSCTALTTSATGVVQCTASAIRFKDALGSIQSEALALDLLHPAVWSYKPEYQSRFGEGIHVGLYADDVAKMDPRCAVYEHGELKNYEDRCVIAHMVAEMQAMKAEISELKRRH